MIRHYFLQIFTFVVAFVFTVRLAELQLISSNYKSLSENNAVLESPVFPDRGFIYDRNNKILVANQPGYDLMVVPENTREFDTLELSRIIGLSNKQLKLKLQKSINYSKKKFHR
jgi:penicillin-binding protein 2